MSDSQHGSMGDQSMSELTQQKAEVTKSILIEKYSHGKMVNTTPPKEGAYKRFIKSRISINDFDILKIIGRGAFGEVLLVRKKDTKEIMAMKKLRKKDMKEKKQLLHVRTERNILAQSSNPV